MVARGGRRCRSLVLLPPFSWLQPTRTSGSTGSRTPGVFVLLALGLNIVVGLAGLLDLGYAAFFAIGAYTYAFAASPFYRAYDLPVLADAARRRRRCAALFGILLGAPTLRLRGDYLAIVTLGFGEIVPIVFLNLEPIHRRHRTASAASSAPTIGDIGSFPTSVNPWPYYLTMVGLITDLDDPHLPAPGLAARPRLDGDPRGRARGGGNGINTVDDEAAGLRARRVDGRLRRRLQRRPSCTTVSPDLFRFDVSFTVLAMVVLGGMGNIWGVALGAFIIYMIQSVVLKQLNLFFDNVQVPDPRATSTSSSTSSCSTASRWWR